MKTVEEMVKLNVLHDKCDVEYRKNGISELYLELYRVYVTEENKMKTVKQMTDLNVMYEACDEEYRLNGESKLYIEMYKAYRLALIKGL